MNLRRFILIINTIIFVFLFSLGSYFLFRINSSSAAKPGSNAASDLLGEILGDFSFSDPVNILLLGGDKVNKNSDTMILVNFDPAEAKVSMLSIPRDTYVHVPGSNVPKINSAYPAGGSKLAVETVQNLLGVHINYFVYVDTSSVEKIVDQLDGVEFTIPVNMDYDDPYQKLHIHLKKGKQHLDGSQVVQFMRFRQPNRYTKEIRKFYDGSDLKRIEAQQAMIKAIIEQKTSIRYITRLNDIINTIFSSIETNLSASDAIKLTQKISKLDSSEINMFKLEGRSKVINRGYYYVHDSEKAQEIIKTYFSSVEGFSNDVFKPSPSANPWGVDRDPEPHYTPKPKKSFTKNNPSNAESSIKGSKTPKP